MLRAHRSRPWNFFIRDDEATKGSTEVDPSGNFTGSLRICVQEVGVDSGGADNDPVYEQTPSHCGHHVVPCILEREPEKDYAENHDWRCEPDGDEARFGFEMAVVALHVIFCAKIESKVACNLTQDRGDHGCEEVQGHKAVSKSALGVG